MGVASFRSSGLSGVQSSLMMPVGLRRRCQAKGTAAGGSWGSGLGGWHNKSGKMHSSAGRLATLRWLDPPLYCEFVRWEQPHIEHQAPRFPQLKRVVKQQQPRVHNQWWRWVQVCVGLGVFPMRLWGGNTKGSHSLDERWSGERSHTCSSMKISMCVCSEAWTAHVWYTAVQCHPINVHTDFRVRISCKQTVDGAWQGPPCG